MMGLSFLIAAILSHLNVLELDPTVKLFIGLVLGEVSKAITNQLSSGDNFEVVKPTNVEQTLDGQTANQSVNLTADN